MSCALPLVGCGGSVAVTTFPDTDGSQPDGAADASPGLDVSAFDVTFPPPDVSVPDVSTPDGSMADSGCGLMPISNPCGSITLTCLPTGLAVGYNPGAACLVPCGSASPGCQVSLLSTGEYDLQCLCGGGRFPLGLSATESGQGTDAVGIFLAQTAALEAAAVRAFEQLARELATHDAPQSLVARVRKAARDEVLHARLLRKAAADRGCTVPRMRSHRAPAMARSLVELAKENAVEGCGRETLGAALLAVQSQRAEPALRPVFARIAVDELAHAELAWDLQTWLESQLDDVALVEVRRAQEAFLAECEESSMPPEARVRTAIGWPTPMAWQTLVSAVRDGAQALAA